MFPLTVRCLACAALMALAALPAAAQPAAKGLSEPALYEFLLGEIAKQRGDYALAAKTYLELARRTRDARIAQRAFEVANDGRLAELAVEAAKTWQEIEPASPAALQAMANALVTARRVEEAEPYLEKLLAAEGVNIERAFLLLNRVLAANPDRQANLRVMRKLAARHAALPEAQLAVAQAAAAAGDEPAALSAAQRASEMKPDWEAPAVLEAQLLQKRSTAAAAKRLADFVERNPGSREGRLSYARALVMDKRMAEARKQFETLLAANPNNAELVYTIGLLAFQIKDYTVAEENMKRLLAREDYRDPDGVRYVLGQIAEEQKQWGRALQWYEQIDDGDHAFPARLRTANAIARQGKLDAAREYLRRVAEQHPGQLAQVTVAEAQLLREANRAQDAFQLLAEALKRDPEQPELLYDYALTAEKLDRFDVLEQNLRKLITIKPDYAHAYNALGYSLAERNVRLGEARKLIEKALELAPDDYFIIDSLGWVQYREGDLKAAAETLRRAYNGRPDAEIGAHLGEVLWMLGERSEANRIWEESLKSAPENETLLKTIKRLRR